MRARTLIAGCAIASLVGGYPATAWAGRGDNGRANPGGPIAVGTPTGDGGGVAVGVPVESPGEGGSAPAPSGGDGADLSIRCFYYVNIAAEIPFVGKVSDPSAFTPGQQVIQR